jgi:hypothetical protein
MPLVPAVAAEGDAASNNAPIKIFFISEFLSAEIGTGRFGYRLLRCVNFAFNLDWSGASRSGRVSPASSAVFLDSINRRLNPRGDFRRGAAVIKDVESFSDESNRSFASFSACAVFIGT